MTRSERDANLSLVPMPRQSWLEPSPLPRQYAKFRWTGMPTSKPRPSMLRRIRNFFGV